MKKKVLIIVENMSVPFDPRVWKEASSLQKNGYDVTVLCPRFKGQDRGHEVIDGVHIYRHPLPQEGHRFLGYLLEYSSALFWEFLYAWWIYLRRGFQVIQGCNPPDTIFLVALPFKLLGVKYIFDHHDANPELFFVKWGTRGVVYKLRRIPTVVEITGAILQIFVFHHTPEFNECRPATDTREMDITPSQVLDVQRDVEKDVQSLLDAHGSNVTNQEAFVVLQVRFRRDGFKRFAIGPIADHEYVRRIKPTSVYSEIAVTAVCSHNHIAKSVGQFFQPNLKLVDNPSRTPFHKV